MKLSYFLLISLLYCTSAFSQKKQTVCKFYSYLYIVKVNDYVGLQFSLEYNLKNKYGILVNLLTSRKNPPDLPDNYNSAFTSINDKLNSKNITIRKKISVSKNTNLSFEPAVGVSYTKYTTRFGFEKDFSLISNNYFYKSEKAYVVGLNIEPKINYSISKSFSLSMVLIANFNLYKNFYGLGLGIKF
jgi:hypothetical protein